MANSLLNFYCLWSRRERSGPKIQARHMQYFGCDDVRGIMRKHGKRPKGKMKADPAGEGKMPEEVRS